MQHAIVSATIDLASDDMLSVVPVLADENGTAGLLFDMGDEFKLVVLLPTRSHAIDLVNAALAAALTCDGPVPDDDPEELRVDYAAVTETQRCVNTMVDEQRACLRAHSHGQGAN